MDILEYNRRAWNHQAASGNEWTVPVSTEAIEKARGGDWSVLLTQSKPVPKSWFPPLQDLEILGLASGGGQQGPILAAAGAHVTVLDNSPSQLDRDQQIAAKARLPLTTVLGDMADLSMFADASFDMVFNPCSVCFAPDAAVVWHEVARVLKKGGWLLTGFINPAFYIFDEALSLKGELKVRHALPYADTDHLNDPQVRQYIAENEPLVFSHSLETLLGGQGQAGLAIVDLYEDQWDGRIISDYMPSFIATRAFKR